MPLGNEPYNLSPRFGGRPLDTYYSPTFTNSVYEGVSYFKDPITSYFRYSRLAERQDFDRTFAPHFEPIADQLRLAATKQEFETLQEMFLKSRAMNLTFNRAPWYQTLGAEIINPTSAVPVFKFFKVGSTLASAKNLGLTSASISATEQMLQHALMPEPPTFVESSAIVTMSGLLSFGFGSAIVGGKKLASSATQNASRRMEDHTQTILEMERWQTLQESLSETAKAERAFGITMFAAPEVRKGFVRLYRWTNDNPIPANKNLGPEYKSQFLSQGRWFTDSLEKAHLYKKRYPNGQLVYVDVLQKTADKWKASKLADENYTERGVLVSNFADDLEGNFFITKRTANQAKEFIEPTRGPFSDNKLRSMSMQLTFQITGLEKKVAAILANKDATPVGLKGVPTLRGDIATLKSQRDQIIDEINMRRLDEGLTVSKDPYGLASSFYDKVDILPQPNKTIARFKIPQGASDTLVKAINRFKKASLLLAADHSLLYAGQKLGLTFGPSVQVMNNLRRGDVAAFESKLIKIWKEDTDAPKYAANAIRKISFSPVTLDKWGNTILKKYIRGEELTPKQKEAGELIYTYFTKVQAEATEAGVIGSQAFIESRIVYKQGEVTWAESKIRGYQKDPIFYSEALKHWEKRLETLNDDMLELQNSLNFISASTVMPHGKKEPYFMRMWEHKVIEKDEKGTQQLRGIMTRWIRQNPYGLKYDKGSGLYKPVDLTGDLEAQDQYVDSVIKSILSDVNPSEGVTSRNTKFPSRAIAIPNSEVVDFINTNLRDVIRTYSTRMGSKIDFAKQFGNRSFREVADELVADLVDGGLSIREANRLRAELTRLYKRVTASTLDDPTSFTARTVQFLKEFTSLNYLGGAGITAIGDIPKMIMENGFKDVFKGSLAQLSDRKIQDQWGDIQQIYGEALELSLGITQQRILEDTGSNVGSNVWKEVKDIGFIANALGPMTVGLKTISGTLSIHRFLDIANRVGKNEKLSEFELELAARYNLDPRKLKEIATAPFEKTKSGLYVANISDWAEAGISTETIVAFRSAVSTNIANTVLTSTPATRFTYADGDVLLNIATARKIFPSIKEHPDFPGYARWESPIMTLPFQFYNFSMSAMNNILHTAAQGQLKSRYAGFASMLGMGYVLAQIKTPSWAWDEMDYDQRFMAAVERSGITAIYGDVALNSIRVAVQLGLNDPSNDLVKLPYYGETGVTNAMTTLLGAGPSTIKDIIDASIHVGRGEYSDALKEAYLTLPLTEVFWLKDDSRSLIDYASRQAFGKY